MSCKSGALGRLRRPACRVSKTTQNSRRPPGPLHWSPELVPASAAAPVAAGPPPRDPLLRLKSPLRTTPPGPRRHLAPHHRAGLSCVSRPSPRLGVPAGAAALRSSAWWAAVVAAGRSNSSPALPAAPADLPGPRMMGAERLPIQDAHLLQGDRAADSAPTSGTLCLEAPPALLGPRRPRSDRRRGAGRAYASGPLPSSGAPVGAAALRSSAWWVAVVAAAGRSNSPALPVVPADLPGPRMRGAERVLPVQDAHLLQGNRTAGSAPTRGTPLRRVEAPLPPPRSLFSSS